VFFHVVMRRHATAVRNRPGQYRMKMATGDAPIEMDADRAIIKLPALAEGQSS
jgi:hypothetical protein